jgi:aspartyl-tRNA(Asn)/glutamyl-tRNA(Gln) amidotransferase subunit C
MTTHNADTGKIDVAYVAHLARIHLTDEEVVSFQAQLGDVVGYVEQLAELDVEGVEPTSHAVPVHNVMRADEPRPGLDIEAAMDNAPASRGREFLVPRIIE